MNKILTIIGLILGIGGAIFALLPSDVHMSLFGGDMDMKSMDMDKGMNKGDSMQNMNQNHGKYVTAGVLSAVIGFALVFVGWKIFD
jgi:hypothetical protein